MTREEYLKLLESSEVFQSLDSDLQKEIQEAEGADMERYEKMFTSERDEILAAQQELVQKNVQAVKEFESESKNERKEYFKNSEARGKQNEEKEAEELLKSLK